MLKRLKKEVQSVRAENLCGGWLQVDFCADDLRRCVGDL